MRLSGGGAHQSKTMMLSELQTLLSTGITAPEELKEAVIINNVLGKTTANTRTLTYRQLSAASCRTATRS